VSRGKWENGVALRSECNFTKIVWLQKIRWSWLNIRCLARASDIERVWDIVLASKK
jgi:hypothetical protein